MFKEVFVLRRDVHSIHGKLLIKKKEPFDLSTLEEICVSHGSVVKVKLRETFVLKDVFVLSKSQPYSNFCSKVGEDNLLKMLGNVSLPVAVLEEYHFLRIKDEYTYKHSLNTAILTLCMAMQFFEDRHKILQVVSSSFTHDIGKSRIPSSILHSHMPLSESEFELIKEHSIYGAVLCSYYTADPYNQSVLSALQHHEKKNGKGYPLGLHLKDQDVMFIVVADIFDALISKRPYRNEPYDVRGAIDVLCKAVENNEIEEEKLKMIIHLNRKTPPPLKEITYSRIYRGFYPRVNYYGLRKGSYTA